MSLKSRQGIPRAIGKRKVVSHLLSQNYGKSCSSISAFVYRKAFEGSAESLVLGVYDVLQSRTSWIITIFLLDDRHVTYSLSDCIQHS